MSLTPVEVRHLSFGRSLLGYRRSSVDHALEEIVASFESVWRDRADLADKVEQLESDLVRYRELETLLRTTLVSAERAAHELKSHAKQQADLVVEEAHAEAREVLRQAVAERERLDLDLIRIRAQLESALESLRGDERRPEAA
jgi:cell division initiation protein